MRKIASMILVVFSLNSFAGDFVQIKRNYSETEANSFIKVEVKETSADKFVRFEYCKWVRGDESCVQLGSREDGFYSETELKKQKRKELVDFIGVGMLDLGIFAAILYGGWVAVGGAEAFTFASSSSAFGNFIVEMIFLPFKVIGAAVGLAVSVGTTSLIVTLVEPLDASKQWQEYRSVRNQVIDGDFDSADEEKVLEVAKALDFVLKRVDKKYASRKGLRKTTERKFSTF